MKAFWLDDKKEISADDLRAEGIDTHILDLNNYAPALEEKAKANGYVTQDVVELSPQTENLAAILAKFRSDPRKPQRRVDAFFSRAGNRLFAGIEQPILVELPAALECAVTERNVVGLRSGEVLKGGTALIGKHDPKVGLVASAQKHARLGWPVPDHSFHSGIRDERVCQRRVGAGGQQIQIAAGLSSRSEEHTSNSSHRP